MSDDVDVNVMQNALDALVKWSDLWQLQNLQISITERNSIYVGRHPFYSIDLKIRDLSLPVSWVAQW